MTPSTTARRPLSRTTLQVALCVLGLWTGLSAQRRGSLGEIDSQGTFSLPRSQDEIALWSEARQELRSGDSRAAVQRLYDLWRRGGAGVVPTPGATSRWTGIRHAILDTLANAPKSGAEAYAKLVEREAGRLATRDLLELSNEELLGLARRFPNAPQSIAARLRLGDLALERGDGLTAQQHYRAARDSVSRSRAKELQLDLRAGIAEALILGRGPREQAEGLDAESLAESLAPASRTWTGFGGGYDGASQMLPFLGRSPMQRSTLVKPQGFAANPFAMHAIGDLDGIYVNDGHTISAFDPLTGDTLWRSEGPMVGSRSSRDSLSAINPDFPLIPAASEDVVVGVLQVPRSVTGASSRRLFDRSVSIIEKIPSRRLFAVDRHTGKALWSHWDAPEGALTNRFEGHDAVGSPLIAGDTVYCAIHDQSGAITFYIAAYDLFTGETKWRRHVCSSQGEVNMFGNARREFAGGDLALRDGVLYGSSNLGVSFALDAEDGDIRWISAYDIVPMPRARLRGQNQRPVYFPNNPVVVADGVMVSAPLDSRNVYGFDTQSGNLLWTLPFDSIPGFPIRWIVGAVGDRLVVSGSGIATVALRPEGPIEQSIELLATPDDLSGQIPSYRIPRPALAGDAIWFLGDEERLDVIRANGRRETAPVPPTVGSGNLLLVDGIAVTVNGGLLTMSADLDALATDARRALRGSDASAEALYRLATLESALAGADLDGSIGERVVRTFQRGLLAAEARGSGPGTEIHRRLTRGLFRTALRRARVVASRNARRGLELLAEAREVAPTPREWLLVQAEILRLPSLDSTQQIVELERMLARYPEQPFGDPRLGVLPVRVYASLEILDRATDPVEIITRAQALIESDGDLEVDGTPIREALIARQRRVLDIAGRETYAAVEARAVEELTRAGDDQDLLRTVGRRFPLSLAAESARRRLLDLAIASGDLGAAISAFRNATAPGTAPEPGLLRRLSVAATSAGNPALARTLALRLRDEAGDQASDYTADDGRNYADAVAEMIVDFESPPDRPTEVPGRELARIEPRTIDDTLDVVAIDWIDGFDRPADQPFLVRNTTRTGSTVHAFSTTNPPGGLDDDLYSIDLENPLSNQVSAFGFGDLLLLAEERRVRGFRISDGTELWSYSEPNERLLRPLDASHGVVAFFSSHIRNSDGGALLTIEPRTGQLVHRTTLDVLRRAHAPVLSNGALWILEPTANGGGVAIERDLIFGHETSRLVLSDSVLRALSLYGDDAAKITYQRIAESLFADDERVFFFGQESNGARAPVVVAVSRENGRIDWKWKGGPNQVFRRFGAFGDQVVVITRNNRDGGQLAVLSAGSGEVLRRETLGRDIDLPNFDDRTREIPNPLVMTDRGGDAVRLTVFDLSPRGRSYRLDLQKNCAILDSPIAAEKWLLVPYWTNENVRPRLLMLQPGSRRRGALPDGREELRLSLTRPLRIRTQGEFVLVRSLDSVTLLGGLR